MKLLLCSHSFDPAVGGIETSSKLLAEQFAAVGVQVVVCTQTLSSTKDVAEYDIWRRPNLRQLVRLGQQCDVVLQNNISLQTLFPLLLARKPIVIVHHTWIRASNGKVRLRDRMKLALASYFRNVCVSEALSAALPFPSEVVMNPVELGLFASYRESRRERDIAFVGRLVSDKGCDLLLRALAQLRERGVVYSLTVLGDGPERGALENLSQQLGLGEQVHFLGRVVEERGRILAQHTVLAVPSRWAEPFGIVVIEALAAGCVPVASRIGGLPEAVAEFGRLVEVNSVDSLAQGLQDALKPGFADTLQRSSLSRHLDTFAPSAVAAHYLKIFAVAIKSPRAG